MLVTPELEHVQIGYSAVRRRAQFTWPA
jgi:hypothetical protein